MKKDKLNTKDGSEFTVFYLGDASEKKSDFLSEPNKGNPKFWLHGQCCPSGPKGEVGEKGLNIDPEKLSDFSEEPNKENIWEGTQHGFTGWQEFETKPEKKSDFPKEPNKECMEEENFYEDPLGNFLDKAAKDPQNWKHIKKFLSEGKLEAITDIGKTKIKKFLKDDLDNYLDKDVVIDDTIKNDIITEPVINEIYRLRGLKRIVKFLGYENDFFKLDAMIGENMNVIIYINPKSDLLIKAEQKDKDYYENI